jgi:hypothetical protein
MGKIFQPVIVLLFVVINFCKKKISGNKFGTEGLALIAGSLQKFTSIETLELSFK